MELWVDISEGEDISDATIAGWKEAGVVGVIVQYSGKLPYYLTRLEPHFRLRVYVYEYFPMSPWDQTPEDRVRACLGMCAGHIVERLYLDVEDPNDPTDPAGQLATVAAIDRCADVLDAAGMPGGGYSGYYAWIERTGNSDVLSRRGWPYWWANYLGEAPAPDLSKMPQNFDDFPPHGGWLKPEMRQWWNTTMFCGHSVDMNAMEEDVPTPITQPTLEEAMEAIIKAGAIMIAGNQNLADLDEVSKNAIRWVAEQVKEGVPQ